MKRHLIAHLIGMLAVTLAILQASPALATVAPLNCDAVSQSSCDTGQCNVEPYGPAFNCCLTYCNPLFPSQGGCCSMQCRAAACTKKYTNSGGCDPTYKNVRTNIISNPGSSCGSNGNCAAGPPDCGPVEPDPGP